MTTTSDQQTTVIHTEESPLRQVGDQVGAMWWVPLVAGLLSIGFGIAILEIDWTVKALVVIAGITLVVRGVTLAFNPSYAADGAGEQVFAGIVTAIAGIVLIAWPEPTLLVLAFIFGGLLAVSGGFHVVSCVARRRHMTHWLFGVAIGVVELLLGIWVMRRPDVTLSLVVTVLGLWTIITGVIYCILAFEIRSVAHEVSTAAPSTIDVRDPQPR
jgi:uncharacterized membrane protein HdeD (DUF308 family)